MAAIDLSIATSHQLVYHQAAVGTTWQQFLLPAWAQRVSVRGESAIYVGWIQTGIASPETPADAGAVGTHKLPIPAATLTEFTFRESSTRETAIRGEAPVASIFVAAQSGTSNVQIVIEKVPS